MDDKNKIKKLEIQIDNLITEKHIKERSDALSKIENKKNDKKIIDKMINIIDKQDIKNNNNNYNMNILDIILGISVLSLVIIDFNNMCFLNFVGLIIIIILLCGISIFNKNDLSILLFLKGIFIVFLVVVLYLKKTEYFDLNILKIILGIFGLYILYDSLNNTNTKEIIKQTKSLPDYKNKFSPEENNDEGLYLNDNEKKIFSGGRNCVNIDNINTDASENKLYYKGNVYDLSQKIIDNKERLKSLMDSKEKEGNNKYDSKIKEYNISNQFLILLSNIKKQNNKADLLFILEKIVNDNKSYRDMNDNLINYTKADLNREIESIIDEKYLIGSICLNDISV